ncbi:hypothetical protein LCGC14_2078800 [marine sediment metagenome]|uniref:Uncharacterized protein n=1 Tax=marine sediment metagenome TaxID=412755 RepID=A0A0F9EGE9_9ZZZZ
MAHVSDAIQSAGAVDGFEEAKPVEDPFAPEHEKFITKRITNRFMVSRQNRWRFEREWIYLLLMASGNQWVVWNRGRRAYRAKKVPKWHPQPVTNKFTPLGETNVASILQQSPNVQWYPLSKEPADIESADAANRINRLIEVETERRRQAHVRARWQVFTGEAFVESFWDNDIKHGTEFQQWERCQGCHSILPPGDIADAGHAGYIVRCVALKRLEVRNLLRQDAVALLDLFGGLVDYGVALIGAVHP